MSAAEILREIWRCWTGRIALILLIIQLCLAVWVVVSTDYAALSRKYLDETAWLGEYPRAVPPCWAVPHHADIIQLKLNTSTMKPEIVEKRQVGRYTRYVVKWSYQFEYKGHALPSDTLLLLVVKRLPDLKAYKLEVKLLRPDNSTVAILAKTPITKEYVVVVGIGGAKGKPKPVALNTLPSDDPVYRSIVDSVSPLIGDEKLLTELGPGKLLWAGRGGKALLGTYEISVVASFYVKGQPSSDTNLSKYTSVYLEMQTLGNCYGLMGTDSVGRPIELGILIGLPWSFVISFYVTFLTTMIGGFYGILAAFASGWRAELLMRIADTVYSIPLLPILIVVVIVTRSYSIWLILTTMVALLWVGPVVVVRSMALQIKSQPYIEAAKAIGASNARILFRYVLPQILPYLVALMVLGIPDPIIIEAALAFLGLSDPTVPTWGKMLEWAWKEHAVLNGWWWSFLFPGLALTVFCATFLMLGRALEPIVAPKLKSR
ncbi:MAG TPA: ABC transporter permease [Pyrodictium sp.]|nr:ABC transporter permease [Pyrodictium sp.]